ncbi:hypothetical protein CRUP_028009 [Coryphaenoides rupestris]|nr:hypothetical protein CRUP_028009 [Coryphaenoides rupestris]
MRSHTKEKPFCCTVCGALFSQGYHLKRHLKVQHVCGALFSQGYHLKRHLRVQHEFQDTELTAYAQCVPLGSPAQVLVLRMREVVPVAWWS